MSSQNVEFHPCGPFDEDEQALIQELVDAVRQSSAPQAQTLLATVLHNVGLLNRLGQVVCDYPSLHAEQHLGSRHRSMSTLIDLLSRSNLSNFHMFLPTRALLNRDLVMAEANFYRLLRYVCNEALDGQLARALLTRVERCLRLCLYTRLAEEVLTHIASDATLSKAPRERAVLSLCEIWDQVSFRVQDFFPLLEVTWEARRRVPTVLGSLMGTAEMFQLIAAGCDPEFVDYLTGHDEEMAAAFREFLFGSTTETLQRIEQLMEAAGKKVIGQGELGDSISIADPSSSKGDPASVLYRFFLSRHLQAAARRLGNLTGPKRTAEEYVMLHYLERQISSTAARAE